MRGEKLATLPIHRLISGPAAINRKNDTKRSICVKVVKVSSFTRCECCVCCVYTTQIVIRYYQLCCFITSHFNSMEIVYALSTSDCGLYQRHLHLHIRAPNWVNSLIWSQCNRSYHAKYIQIDVKRKTRISVRIRFVFFFVSNLLWW